MQLHYQTVCWVVGPLEVGIPEFLAMQSCHWVWVRILKRRKDSLEDQMDTLKLLEKSCANHWSADWRPFLRLVPISTKHDLNQQGQGRSNVLWEHLRTGDSIARFTIVTATRGFSKARSCLKTLRWALGAQHGAVLSWLWSAVMGACTGIYTATAVKYEMCCSKYFIGGIWYFQIHVWSLPAAACCFLYIYIYIQFVCCICVFIYVYIYICIYILYLYY